MILKTGLPLQTLQKILTRDVMDFFLMFSNLAAEKTMPISPNDDKLRHFVKEKL